MKQWLQIFLLIWGLATISADEEYSPRIYPTQISAQILAENTEHVKPYDGMPLLGTTSSSSMQCSGADVPASGKGGRQAESSTSHVMGLNPGHTLLSAEWFVTRHVASPPNIRTGARYIYFLRRIII